MGRDPWIDHAQVRTVLVQAVQKVCPAWLASRREDLVQAAWLRVAEMLQRGAGAQQISDAYVWRVATTAVIDEIRKLRAERKYIAPSGEEVDAPAAAAGPGRLVLSGEIRAAIADCLRRMILPRRRVVTLHLIGYTAGEIAETTGADLKRARNLIFRGLSDLRGCLSAKGIHP